MFTVAFGFRITAKPSWPWNPRFKGWITLFWFHFLFSAELDRTSKLELLLTSNETQALEVFKQLDLTKRKTLQPGEKAVPPGFPEVDFDKLLEIQAAELIKKPAKPKKGKGGRNKPLQPGNVVEDGFFKEEALKKKPFEHKFFGTQLVVDDIVVIRQLNNHLHHMEITAHGQLYIDKQPYPVNPTDLMKIKKELEKAQTT